ncbi:MAG: hypothetical protein IJK36_04830 [Bacteroidales bacterium]|nr:hypothetical protein [Bacteroidales bacterium]
MAKKSVGGQLSNLTNATTKTYAHRRCIGKAESFASYIPAEKIWSY